MKTQHDRTGTLTTSARVTQRARASRTGVLALTVGGLMGCGASPPVKVQDATTLAPEPERAPWPEEAMPESVVHAEFQTSAQAIKPRGKFLLAVRFQIAQGYRISWTNPGDVGKSTRVEFQVPPGFSVGPLQFPAPTRFELPGDLVSYGYEGETAVFAEVTTPERPAQNEAYRFDVKAEWLACKTECADEELSAWFELAFGARAPEPRLPDELVAHHASIPKAFADVPTANHEWKGSLARPALTLTAPDVKWVDFFPSELEQPKLIGMKPSGDALSLKFEGTSPSRPLRGLAVGEVEGKVAFFDVNVPWPVE